MKKQALGTYKLAGGFMIKSIARQTDKAIAVKCYDTYKQQPDRWVWLPKSKITIRPLTEKSHRPECAGWLNITLPHWLTEANDIGKGTHARWQVYEDQET